jgi:hypothetical protein
MESSAYEAWESTGNGLPLLDSFLKESARINPLDNCTRSNPILFLEIAANKEFNSEHSP